MQQPFPFLALLLLPSLPSVTPCWLSLLPSDSHGISSGFQVDLFHVFPGIEAAVPGWSSGCPKDGHKNCLFPGMLNFGDTTRPAPSKMLHIWSQGSICLNGFLIESPFITGDASPLGFSAHSASTCPGIFLCVCYSHFPSWKFQPLFHSNSHPGPWCHRICLQQGVLTGKFQTQTLFTWFNTEKQTLKVKFITQQKKMITLFPASLFSPWFASCVWKLNNILDILRNMSLPFCCAVANPAHTNKS